MILVKGYPIFFLPTVIFATSFCSVALNIQDIKLNSEIHKVCDNIKQILSLNLKKICFKIFLLGLRYGPNYQKLSEGSIFDPQKSSEGLNLQIQIFLCVFLHI